MGLKGMLMAVLASVAFGVLFNLFRDEAHLPPANLNPGYDLKSLHLPLVRGFAVQVIATAFETWPFSSLLIRKSELDNGFDSMRSFATTLWHTKPTFLPLVPPSAKQTETAAVESKKVEETMQAIVKAAPKVKGGKFRYFTSADYHNAYQTGSATPVDVAKSIIQFVKDSEKRTPPLNHVVELHEDKVLKQAEASSKRWKAKKTLGALDGVPVLVKVEIGVEGHKLTTGTQYLGDTPEQADATAVARLRAAGAIIVGTVNMHEYGASVFGINLWYGTPRNPYNVSHYTGGSSSGSAAAVGSGIVPIALGTDGGGSIRIPSSLCGAFGLKPTYGRVSAKGEAPIAFSIGHLGPIAASTADAALAYATIAGRDVGDSNTHWQPTPHLGGLLKPSVKGLRVGVFRPHFNDATPEIVAACNKAVAFLESSGAVVSEIEMPNLQAVRSAHITTIFSEFATTAETHRRNHGTKLSGEVRAVMAVGRGHTARDYINSQKIRSYLMGYLDKLYESVDVIVSPTTGNTAPNIADADLEHGVIDAVRCAELVRYAFIANFAGNPAMAIPVGLGQNNLPISLQVMGRHWEENLLLQISQLIEENFERFAPQVFFPVLSGKK